ncbi:hypothetical protein [Corallococcus carmarthensis]|uniref:Uncharacterized protein n=1 Tax=Corallococcus carmarthensis TaxID=2316728 RepID=A0A3A8KA51_9BACT|nr:hypothetical protein [Corallococcus carmarthensis]RKH05043.1 hypothetical protein D7X32_08985 [Corallococcus carmarthensis]
MKPADVSGLPKELEEVRRIALGEVPADEAQVRAALAQAWAWLAPLTSALLPAEPSPGAAKHTTEDVERWFRAVVARTKGSTETVMARMLRDAALEGAKVPGLVADNAVLLKLALDDVPACDWQSGRGTCDETGRQPRCQFCLRRDELMNSPGASMLAEHETKVSALQAQVAHLTAELDNLKDCEQGANAVAVEAMAAQRKAESEQDEERKAVEAMTKAIDKHLPGICPAQSPDEGIHLLAEQRDAAQARVAELERELRIRNDDHAFEQDMRIKTESERDALRAGGGGARQGD